MDDSFVRTVEDVAVHLGTDLHDGLTDNAADIARRRYGRNEMPPEEKTPLWKLILEQFEDRMVQILLVAAGISLLLTFMEGTAHDLTSFVEPVVIMMILIANATVGVIQETNAEKAIEALKAYESEEATVIRGGHVMHIAAQELVPGDLVEVAVGGKIPADCRFVQMLSTAFRVDQALLTGETNSVNKEIDAIADPNALVQDKRNMIFSGTTVAYGKGRAIVVRTGAGTEIGRIRQSITEADETISPMKRKLDEFGEMLSKYIGVICIVVWLMNINHFTDPEHGGLLRGAVYYFKIAVALAVAAIPEGLPAVVTTCLALGTRRMAKRNAIVRSLPSVETLGCTSVICSDKTGTLTTNQMSVKKIVLLKDIKGSNMFQEYDVDGSTYQPRGAVADAKDKVELTRPLNAQVSQPALAMLTNVMSLCNDSNVHYNHERKCYEVIGESTEGALRVLVEKLGNYEEELPTNMPVDTRVEYFNHKIESAHRKLATLEFSRDRKSMSVVVQPLTRSAAPVTPGRPVTRSQSKHEFTEEGSRMLLVKGAPDLLLNRCTKILLNNERVEPLTKDLRERILERVSMYGSKEALRCLGAAYKEDVPSVDKLGLSDPANFVKVESDLVFIGFVGMMDPPRPEVAAAIQECKEAGIRVIVVTGDNKATAEAVCRRIGLFGPEEDTTGMAFTGREFDVLSERDQRSAVRSARLFARVEPVHKQKLVSLLQEQGEIVAMTGDGVNDAPALSKADIGIAMGTGTAVAKGASDMVLADDNFSTIVNAVEEGRSIYNNTKQFIRFLISSNIGEVVCIFLAAALGIPEVLSPVQLLWVNLVTDGLPATALGFNPPETGIMKRPPRSASEPIVNGFLFFRYVVVGAYVGIATVLGPIWWYMYNPTGPMMSWSALLGFHTCKDGITMMENGFTCSVFHTSFHPATMALTILVTIEMFNAFNATCENQSIVAMPPWKNMWLIYAVCTSFALHFAVLYIPYFSILFSVVPLTFDEWFMVLALSFPIILIDEVCKFVARNWMTVPATTPVAVHKTSSKAD